MDVDASKNLRNVGNEAEKAANKFSPLIAAGLALGPALIPIAAAASTAVAGLSISLLSGGAALGVFGAVTKTVYGQVTTASGNLTTTTQRLTTANVKVAQAHKAVADAVTARQKSAAGSQLASALRAQATATDNLSRANKALVGPLGDATRGYVGMTTAWKDFVSRNSPAVFSLLAKGFGILAMAVPKLQPLFTVAMKAVKGWVDQLGHFVSGGGLGRLVSFLAQHAGPALKMFGQIATDIFRGFGTLGKAFGTTADGIIGSLKRMADKFGALKPGTLQRFLDYVKQNGPAVTSTLKDLAGAALKIVADLAPLAPISLALASGLAAIIKAAPPSVIRALAAAYVVATIALKAFAVYQAIANAEMFANPIGILILALVALGVEVFIMYKHWREVWAGILRFTGPIVAVVLQMVQRLVDGFLGGLIAMVRGLSHLPFIGKAFTGLANTITGFRNRFDGDMSHAIVAASTAGTGIGRGVSAAIPSFQNVIANAHGMAAAIRGLPTTTYIRIITAYSSLGDPTQRAVLGKAVGHQHGTSWAMPGWALVGEGGPEWLRFYGGERVLPHGVRPPRVSTSGGTEMLQPIVLQVDGKTLWQSLLRVKRNNGSPLGLT